MNIFFSLAVYSIQIILPFLGVLVVYCCFKSLFSNLSIKRPFVVLFNKSTKEKIPITYWENSIGRDKHCDVIVNSPSASRDHAVFYRRDQGWFISDTNSKGGIFLNGKPLKSDEKVYIGDVIQIGGMNYELYKSDTCCESREKEKFLPKKNFFAGASLLFVVSLFHLLGFAQLCFSGTSFDYRPALIFSVLFGFSWICYFVNKYGFRRKNFEIEALGIFLSGIGIITCCSAGVYQAYVQTAALIAGIIFYEIILMLIKDPDIAMKFRPYIAAIAILLLIFNLVFGKVKNGSQNWIMLGPVSFQPSEFVKVAFVFYGTSTLKGIQMTKNLTAFIIFSALCMGALFLMGDFGTACVFFVTFILISFMRSGSIRTVFLTCTAATLGLGLILKFKPYIVSRFSAWRHVWEHVNDTGYQQTRVLTYSASGGLFGMGLGKGCLKYVFAAPSDLVFGMLVEEWGLFLGLLVLFSLVLLGVYARSASIRSRSCFYSIISCCGAGMLVFQMMLNVFGVVDIFPLTGVTLPFISLGGSSLVSVWGILAFIKASDERTYGLRR